MIWAFLPNPNSILCSWRPSPPKREAEAVFVEDDEEGDDHKSGVSEVGIIAMAVPQTPSTSPNLYPHELQLKLYQAFIFSIPILFSIILFLLFYLFYLKRRASSLSSPTHFLPTTTPPTTYPCRLDLTIQFLDTLPRILFDEELKARDSQCCVCLGEFELKEEVVQIPQCKHVFHRDCIYHWLHSHSTCPLCRCCIMPTTKFLNNPPSLHPPPPPIADEAASDSASAI